MIASKVSLHIGAKYSVRHNLRQFGESWNRDGHIYKELSCLNEILVNVDVQQFFDRTFGDALVEFDLKNQVKHPDRVFGLGKDEYENAVKSKGKEIADKLRREKAVSKYYQQQKKNIREVITQLGDKDEFEKLIETVGISKAREIHREYLEDFFQKWQEKNPSLKVFCATIHLDEVTPHLHIDFVPVANSEKGLKTKVSMDGALSELGYKRSKTDKYSETSFKRWLKDFRADNEQRSQNFLDKQIPKTFLILPSEATKTGHTQPEAHKDEVQKTGNIKKAISDFINGKGRIKEDAVEQIIKNAQIAEKAITAQANEVLANNKEQALINQAFSDELNRRAEDLKKREARVSEREKNLDTKSDSLKRTEQSLAKRESLLNQKLLDTVLKERQARAPLEEVNRQNEYYLQQLRLQLKQQVKQVFKNRGYER